MLAHSGQSPLALRRVPHRRFGDVRRPRMGTIPGSGTPCSASDSASARSARCRRSIRSFRVRADL